MAESLGQSPRAAYLDEFADLCTVISMHVQREYLLPYKKPHFEWPMKQPLPFGRLGDLLHRLYARRDSLVDILPSSNKLMLGFAFVLVLEIALPWIIVWLSTVPWLAALRIPRAYGYLLLSLSIGALVAFVVPFFAIGSYWMLLEIMSNRLLTRRFRVLTILIVLALIALWWTGGMSLLSDSMDYGDLGMQKALAVQQSHAYRAFAALLILIPAISQGGLWLVQLVVSTTFEVRSAVHWLLSFHVVHSVDSLNRFLSTPLELAGNKMILVLELRPATLDALYEWSNRRREVVQSKLVPTTLFLTFLGLLANTDLGNDVVNFFLGVVQEYFQRSDSVSSFVALLKLALLLMLILVPARFIFDLLTEAFTMDFITQACVLAKAVQAFEQEEIAESRVRGRVPSPASRLGRWLYGLTRPFHHGSES